MYGPLLSEKDNYVFIQYNLFPGRKVIKYLLSSLLSLAPPSTSYQQFPAEGEKWQRVEGEVDAGRRGGGEVGGGGGERLFTLRFLV